MYRIAREAIPGFTRRGDRVSFTPRVPAAWPEFTIEYRFGNSVYTIVVRQPGDGINGDAEVSVDGVALDTPHLQLVDDGRPHEVVVRSPASRARMEATAPAGEH